MSLHGNSVEERIWNYLYEKIGNKFGVAGLMGNLYAESGLIFNRVEMLCLKRLKENGKTYTDATYTADVDSGKISRAEFLNPLPGKVYGYSIAQWTSTNRKAGLYDSAKAKGVSIADEENCLEFLLTELNGSYKSVMSVLKNAKSVREASDIVLKKFEVPANMGTSVQEKRASYGQNYYNKYAKINGVSSLGGNTMTESELRRKVATWLDSYLGCAEGSAKHREILSIFNNSKSPMDFSIALLFPTPDEPIIVNESEPPIIPTESIRFIIFAFSYLCFTAAAVNFFFIDNNSARYNLLYISILISDGTYTLYISDNASNLLA